MISRCVQRPSYYGLIRSRSDRFSDGCPPETRDRDRTTTGSTRRYRRYGRFQFTIDGST